MARVGIERAAPLARLVPAAIAREIGEILELLAGDVAIIGVGDEHRIALARQPPRHLPLGFTQARDIGPEQHQRAGGVGGMDEEPVHRPTGRRKTHHALGQRACVGRSRFFRQLHRGACRDTRRQRPAAEGPPRNRAARPARQLPFVAHGSSLLAITAGADPRRMQPYGQDYMRAAG
jgi:hypothetical protein